MQIYITRRMLPTKIDRFGKYRYIPIEWELEIDGEIYDLSDSILADFVQNALEHRKADENSSALKDLLEHCEVPYPEDDETVTVNSTIYKI